jgi:hypothetical protein
MSNGANAWHRRSKASPCDRRQDLAASGAGAVAAEMRGARTTATGTPTDRQWATMLDPMNPDPPTTAIVTS